MLDDPDAFEDDHRADLRDRVVLPRATAQRPRRVRWAVVDPATGDEYPFRYESPADAAEILTTGWAMLRPSARVVEAPRALPRRRA